MRFLDAFALTGDEDEAYAVIKGYALAHQARTSPWVPASTPSATPATAADTEVTSDRVREVGGGKVTRSQKRQLNQLLSNQQQPSITGPSCQMPDSGDDTQLPSRKKIKRSSSGKTATKKCNEAINNDAPSLAAPEAKQRHRHTQQRPDTFAPRPLGTSSDGSNLSDLHSFLRCELIEVFCANGNDVRKSSKSVSPFVAY